VRYERHASILAFIIRMSLSVRFGTVLIGLGILFLGFYVQKRSIQGFQNGTVSLPTAAESAVERPANTNPPLINVVDIDVLVQKDKEIRSKMNMVVNAKSTSDLLLINYISSDMMANLNIIYKEIMEYAKSISNIADLFSRTDEKHQNTLRQLVYTTSDQVDILYTVYYTIPSNIISTDAIIPSGTAPMSAINNPEVVAESAKQVTNVLSTLPSPSAKLNKYLNDLMKSIQSLPTDSSSNDIADFTSKLKKYLNTVDIQQEYMTTNIADLKSASMRYTVDPAKTEGADDNKKTFLTTTITSFQSIITALEAKNMTNPEIIDNVTKLQARVTSMQANLTSMKTPARLEGFASIMNPYDQPSANSRQAHEFALGQRTFIDNVFSSMRI
jgi:hypothetical protein